MGTLPRGGDEVRNGTTERKREYEHHNDTGGTNRATPCSQATNYTAKGASQD